MLYRASGWMSSPMSSIDSWVAIACTPVASGTPAGSNRRSGMRTSPARPGADGVCHRGAGVSTILRLELGDKGDELRRARDVLAVRLAGENRVLMAMETNPASSMALRSSSYTARPGELGLELVRPCQGDRHLFRIGHGARRLVSASDPVLQRQGLSCLLTAAGDERQARTSAEAMVTSSSADLISSSKR